MATTAFLTATETADACAATLLARRGMPEYARLDAREARRLWALCQDEMLEYGATARQTWGGTVRDAHGTRLGAWCCARPSKLGSCALVYHAG